MSIAPLYLRLFFFNDTATTEIYTLSLHDALPILRAVVLRLAPPGAGRALPRRRAGDRLRHRPTGALDRKSTLLNSSHMSISYAVFCLKKKKKTASKIVKTTIAERRPESSRYELGV